MSLFSKAFGLLNVVRKCEDSIKSRPVGTLIALCCAANFLNSVDRILMPIAIIHMTDQYGWNLQLQGFILSSFSIGYLVSQLIAERASSYCGGKRVLLFAMSLWASATFLLPFTVENLPILLCLRIILGLAEGLSLPTIYHMFAYKVPMNQKTSAFGYLVALGSISQVFTAMISPHLEWQLMFYVIGLLGFVWLLLWIRYYPKSAVPDSSVDSVPLLYSAAGTKSPTMIQYFSCWPVWAIYIAHFSMNWSNYIILNWLPTYLVRNLRIDIKNISFTAIAYLANSLCGISVGHVTDYMTSKRKFSTLAIRRWMTAVGLMVPAICLLIFAFVHTLTWAIVVLTLAMSACAFNSSGHLSNHADIAGNFAGMTFMISNTLATIPGILCGPVTAELVYKSSGRWFPIFALAASINFAGAAVYASQSSDRPQWSPVSTVADIEPVDTVIVHEGEPTV